MIKFKIAQQGAHEKLILRLVPFTFVLGLMIQTAPNSNYKVSITDQTKPCHVYS